MLGDIMNPFIFKLGSYGVRWYSLLILIGVILGIILIKKEGKRFNISGDMLFNLAFWTIIIGILGARIYYVLFNFSTYRSDPISILKIWEGGLAIHGGLIAGVITMIIYCKKNELRFIKIADISAPALILAQAIGRWGNFFNSEAHGAATSYAHLKSLHIPSFIIKGMHISGIYYEPTFFYESILCFLGFIIMIIIRRTKHIKVGTLTCFYLMYYGLIRFFIESMRTDSLMLCGFKMAQIVSVLMFLSGLIALLIISRKGKYEDLYNDTYEKSN